MSQHEVEVLYECFVCGKGYSKVQALRGHMKGHRGHGFIRTSIWANGEKWRRFQALCKDHKTTTCHLLDVLIEAALKGKELGVIDIGSPNPAIINISHVFLGKPRSPFKVDVGEAVRAGPACPSCGCPEISQFSPVGLEISEGRCLRCGARWLVSPGGQGF